MSYKWVNNNLPKVHSLYTDELYVGYVYCVGITKYSARAKGRSIGTAPTLEEAKEILIKYAVMRKLS